MAGSSGGKKRMAGQGGWEPLLELLRKFRDDRDWKQFHNPKDLAAAIAIEAGELQEHFLWKAKDEVAADLADAGRRQAVVDEFADILICTLLLADCLGIDIDEAVRTKTAANARKYPVSQARGTARKYTELRGKRSGPGGRK
jgi:NTP pyrophosphatase (non-canonical NTP hydrolase)